MKNYSTPSRKPMMYGGMAPAKPKKKMMGGMTDKKMMAKGGMPMVEKDGKKMPAFAADGKGKMMYGGKAKKK
tara:strand:+ start:176 stop:391 length:216 start_codon:yes stop_codon:yes gene_type:complete